MFRSIYYFGLIPIACFTMTVPRFAHAQPTPVQAPKAANPPIDKGFDGTKFGAEMARMMKMTPAEMKAEVMKLEELQLRTSLKAAGFNDLELQETVWNFVLDQEAARQSLRHEASQLQALVNNANANEGAVTAQMGLYQLALETEKERRAGAVSELSEELRLSTRPRLKIWLSLQGILDDAPWLIGDTLSLGTIALGSAMAFGNLPAEKAAPVAAEKMKIQKPVTAQPNK